MLSLLDKASIKLILQSPQRSLLFLQLTRLFAFTFLLDFLCCSILNALLDSCSAVTLSLHSIFMSLHFGINISADEDIREVDCDIDLIN